MFARVYMCVHVKMCICERETVHTCAYFWCKCIVCVSNCVCACVCVCVLCTRARSGVMCKRMQVCECEGVRILMLVCVRVNVRTTECLRVCVREFVRETVPARMRAREYV